MLILIFQFYHSQNINKELNTCITTRAIEMYLNGSPMSRSMKAEQAAAMGEMLRRNQTELARWGAHSDRRWGPRQVCDGEPTTPFIDTELFGAHRRAVDTD